MKPNAEETLKIIPFMDADHVKSKGINPLDSRKVDPIAVLKQGHFLIDSVASLQIEDIFSIKMLKLIIKKEGSISDKYIIKDETLYHKVMNQDVIFEALVVSQVLTATIHTEMHDKKVM